MTQMLNPPSYESQIALRANVNKFAAQWEREQGYKPAPFQKAIALQRLARGQTIREIIDALVAMRVS
jgi:hypothetical protein